MTAKEAEKLLLKSGFLIYRQKGSHRIYKKGNVRFVLPFHPGKELHPKFIKELRNILGE
jgi:predicted RNA binding protein YcfA (HicA-like mRNA interferase family)